MKIDNLELVKSIILGALAQLEREMICERVRAGMANAKAKGKRIGRVKKRNSVLIRSLLEAKLSYREIARIAKCSHGSVHAELAALSKEQKEARQMAKTQIKLKKKSASQTPDPSAGPKALGVTPSSDQEDV